MRNFRFEASAYGAISGNARRRYNAAISSGYTPRQATGLARGYYGRR
jgi:hypothetical protein